MAPVFVAGRLLSVLFVMFLLFLLSPVSFYCHPLIVYDRQQLINIYQSMPKPYETYKLTLNSRVFAFIRRQIPLIFLDICAGKFSMSQVGDARIKLALALAALLILGQHVVCWTRNGVYGWYSDRGILLCVFGLTCRTHLSTFHDTTPLGFGEGRLTIVICAHSQIVLCSVRFPTTVLVLH